jgi:hypothetical protein
LQKSKHPSDYFSQAKQVACAMNLEINIFYAWSQVCDLSWAIATINARNRMAIAFRSEPGKYTPHAHA